MFAVIKVAGLGAVLSAGLVSAFGPPGRAQIARPTLAASEEMPARRVAANVTAAVAMRDPEDAGRTSETGSTVRGCLEGAWPYYRQAGCAGGSSELLGRATVGLERQADANQTAPVRVPASAIGSR